MEKRENRGVVVKPDLTLKVGQTLNNLYTILGEDDLDNIPPEPTTEPAQSVGQGGAGTVYLAAYRKMQLRAVKFLTLTSLYSSTGQRLSDFQRTFAQERLNLAKLSHGSIARLYDIGEYVDENEERWQYIVLEYIDGDHLKETLESLSVSPVQAYELITDVLRAVEYLHDKNVLHADLKSDNIKCRKLRSSPQAVVLDLGVAHQVPTVDEDEDPTLPILDGLKVRFITSPELVHERHKRYVNSYVDREDLRELFPSHDLHCLGVLFDELCSSAAISKKLTEIIGVDGMHAFRTMIYCLKEAPAKAPTKDRPDHKRVILYTTVHDALQDWLKLRRTYLAPVGVPEISLAAEFKYAVPTAVGRALITPRLSHVVGHQLFKRLQRVPQLEMTQGTYPGATHTRYAHSLSVLRNARYYLAHLLNDPNFRLLAEPADLQATILLALLHDVGHYQLSHMFEDFSSSQRLHRNHNPWRSVGFDIPSDDDLFWHVIDPEPENPLDPAIPTLRGDYGKAVSAAWRDSETTRGMKHTPTLREIIVDDFGPDTYEAMRRIHNSIYRRGSYTPATTAQLVMGAVLSSDIDADKVSYLLEDAARSGVNYGAGVDFDGLLGALRMPAPQDVKNRTVLAITLKGLAAAQSVAINRNLMVGQVYWHHHNRAATAMVKYAVARLLLTKDGLNMPEYIKQSLFMEYDHALHYLHDKFEDVRDRTAETNPIAGILESDWKIYTTAYSTARVDRELGRMIGNNLITLRFDDLLDEEERLTEIVRNAAHMPDIKKGEVLLDVPLKEREHAKGDRGGEVLVYEDRTTDEGGKELRDYTPFLKMVSQQHVAENRICRVFVAPEIPANIVNGAIARHMAKEYGRES